MLKLRTILSIVIAVSLVSVLIGCGKSTGVDNLAPTITTQPAALTVTAGAAATFTVVATGTPAPTYQWQKDGANCTGASATTATFTISAVATTDAGTYTVIVTNIVGHVTSNGAALTVNVGPAITTQPSALTVTAGAAATFTVVATGTPAVTYQWKKDGVDLTGASATTATFTIAAAALTDAGTYTVVVTNSVASVTSTGAALTVTAAGLDVKKIFTDTTTLDSVGINGWNLYSWDGTGTFQDPPASTYSGPTAKEYLAGTSGWAGIGFQPKGPDTATGINVSAYTYLHFWIKSNATGVITACCESKDMTGNAPSLPITSYGFVQDSTIWQEIKIPLADFPEPTGNPIDKTQINVYAGFVMAGTTAGQWMILDDIWFSK
jgi:hypothetical protein